jgi:hypothetical protein
MGSRRKASQASCDRGVPSSEGVLDQQEKEQEEQKSLIHALMRTLHHFFGAFSPLFANVTDPRDPLKIIYPLASLTFAGVMLFLFRLKARRQIGFLLRNGPSVCKFQVLFEVERFPHGDTLEATFSNLEADQVQSVVTGMTETLIRKKVLYDFRLLGIYFIVVIDGTGTLRFSRRHCPHCLTRTHHGKTLYYHPVLEAKLVTFNGFAFSLMSEFIENPGEKMTKQDCELKAFYRLAQRLKTRFPRLPILLSMDGLFAGGPTFALCRRYGWKFMIVLKDDDLPSVNEEFAALSPLQLENRLSWRTGKEAQIQQVFRWVDDIAYVDTQAREHTLSVIECLETKPAKEGKRETTKFKWVTNCNVSSKNVTTLSNEGGRIRWKIENEGFNVQKRGGYELEHAYTTDPTSAKIFYFLLQIAHLLAQLLLKADLLKRQFPGGFGSAKNLAFRLLEAWRNARMTKADIDTVLQKRFQIRFDSS